MKVPSPPLFVQCKLVTLVDKASEVVITLPSQIVWEAPELTLGFFWIGIRTIFVTETLQGGFGTAVIVRSIYPLTISVKLGVTNGVNDVEFDMVVPVAEVQLYEVANCTPVPLTNTLVIS